MKESGIKSPNFGIRVAKRLSNKLFYNILMTNNFAYITAMRLFKLNT